MTDVENSIVVGEAVRVIKENKKIYKTKEYVRRANNKYKKKKYAEDSEYREKHLKGVADAKKKNAEHYNEYRRKYMREYRAKKKAEAEKQAKETGTNVDNDKLIESVEKLKVADV